MTWKKHVYIAKAMFFETRTLKHKPIYVGGRDFYSLTYRYSGRASISVGETEMYSEADSVTFMPKGLAYTTEVHEDVYMAVVHFDFECDSPPTMPTVVKMKNSAIRALFKTLMKNGEDTSANLSRMSTLYEILSQLEAATVETERKISEKIERARAILDAEFCDSGLSVGEVAEMVGVSAAYLRREFRNAYGVSPVGYLKELRIKKAKILLLNERYSAARIAEECGYSCSGYFIQDFHKSTGESPGSYRSRLLESP